MDPHDASGLYNAYYFAHACGRPYQRDEEWLQFFGRIAERIVSDIIPATVLDTGSAMGFLVEALRDRGVEAFGVDISEYAIQNARPDIRPYCWVGSVTDVLPQTYDLIVCIELLEHLSPREADQAMENICQHTDDVLFSSAPDDYKEATHFNVQPPQYWAEMFARHGFFRDVDFDASFITPWAVRFRKAHGPVARVIGAYERRLWRLQQETVARRELSVEQRNELLKKEQAGQALRAQVAEKERAVRVLADQLAAITNSREFALLRVLWRIESWLRPPSRLAERDRVVRRVSAQLAERDQELRALSAQVAERERELQTLSAQVGKRHRELQALSAQVGETDQELQTLSAQVGETDQELRTLSAHVAEKEQALQAAGAQVAEWERELQTLSAHVAERERELQALSAELAERKQPRKTPQAHIAEKQSAETLIAQLREWEMRWTVLQMSEGYTLLQKLLAWRLRLVPPGTRRERLMYRIFRGVAEWRRRGSSELIRHLRRQIAWSAKVLFHKMRGRVDHRLTGRVIEVDEIQPRVPVRPHQPTVDIIICVHNALSDVQRCLASVVDHTRQPYSLILVDDGSDAQTHDYLSEFADTQGALLLRNEEAKGYTRAANQGLHHSSADYAVPLNSDTVVTPGWLDRLIACAESDPRIGLVGPLSNTASWQSIPEIESQSDWAANPLPARMTIEEMGSHVARYSGRLYPAMPFLNGFCLLIRRQVIQEIGYFDEDGFGAGYGEENDYALRARKGGWRLALADDAYVYHAQSRSYPTGARKRLSQRADVLLAKKHGPHIVSEGVAYCQRSRVLEGIRARSRVMLARQEWIKKGRAKFAGRRVLFVLPIAEPGGGGNVVVCEGMAMREMGVDVSIFNLNAFRQRFECAYPALETPVIYGEREHLATLATEYDAAIATLNSSVEWLGTVIPRGGRPVRGYYVQDFEPYIYAPGTEDFQRACASYTLFPELVRFTKTEWTQQEVRKRIGAPCTVVGPSVDIDLFRPRPRSGPEWPERPITIAAMVRPSTPRREPKLTMELLRQASRRYGGRVEIVIFGTSLDDPGFAELPRDFPWNLAGVLNRKQIAGLLNGVDVFVDFSSHQAMGLTALEAMACGAAVIVPERGGAVSFARHEENSLVVDTSSPEACWRALERLIEDHSLRSRLQRTALVDVCYFFPERPAFNILSALFDAQDQRVS